MNSKNLAALQQGEAISYQPFWSGKFWILLAVLVPILALGLGSYSYFQNTRPLDLEPLGKLSSKASYQKLAAYLNSHVRLKDFHAELHLVDEDENFWGIAKDYGVDIDTIVGCNPDLEDLSARLNEPLLAVTRRGVLYQVKAGEGIKDVAQALSVSAQLIADANPVSWFGLREGAVLFIPSAKPYIFNGEMAKLYQQRHLFRSPLSGRYTSLVGIRIDPFTGDHRHHNGVDIKSNYGTLVSAAASGVVEYAGWNGGYGKCVIIRHGSGFKTLYGHMSVLLVKTGQKIRQGHYVGKVGMTGRTTGPHLHFTIWLHNKVQNPLKYLW